MDVIAEPAQPVVHLMTPTAVAVLLLIALTVDYMTVGPGWLRDRAAFLFALVAIREGFNGSPLDAWTVGSLSGLIQNALDSTGGAYIAGASVNVLLGAAVACVGVYVIGQMMPVKFAKKLGRFAALKFRPSPTHRLNGQLWVCALLLGLMLDLPGGNAGVVLRWLYDIDLHLVAPLPGNLFGGA